MPKFKEVNFWLLYLIIAGIILSISLVILYSEWNANKNKYIQELSSLNRITAQNTLSSLRNQESILNILGKNLLTINAYSYPEDGRRVIEEMIEVNKGLVAFGLAKFNGQLILVSTLKEGVKLPNLMDNEKTRESFMASRKNPKMSLGRTYFMKQLNKWVIPIRMGVLNRHGEFPLVMTAGIQANGGDTVLNVKELPSNVVIQIVRDDGYLQFQNPLNEKDFKNVYNNLFDEETFNKIKKFKNDKIELIDTSLTNTKTLTSLTYLEDYNLYVLVSLPYKIINKNFFNKLYVSIFLLFLILLALYFLFRYSINIQNNTRKQLRYIANHDSLTGLHNRYALNEEIEEKISLGDSFYVLFLDLDNFKHVNDTYGHRFGDLLLKEISRRLKSIMIDGDFLARNGGDEFVLLINENQNEPIRNLASKILHIISKPIIINENELFTATSIGISKYDEIGVEASDLLNRADISLYKAKETKNSYVFFSNSIYNDSKEYLEIETELRHAIQKNEFTVLYQPKIDSKNHKMIAVEALIRWHNSKLGFVSPEKFISVAEKSGIINNIGEFVLRKAQEDIEDVWKKTDTGFLLSVNVSPRQLVSLRDMQRFKKVINDSSFPKDKFIIEVTENVFIGDMKKIISFLNIIKGYGIGISLDDFGTGYSSLSVLSKLPITELKVDKSFVQNMLLNDDNMMLVKSIINIGKEMHVKVVAEGVESQEELQVLADFGCDIYQGYFFSKPLNKDDLITYIKNQK